MRLVYDHRKKSPASHSTKDIDFKFLMEYPLEGADRGTWKHIAIIRKKKKKLKTLF